jgi:hypothetical protein
MAELGGSRAGFGRSRTKLEGSRVGLGVYVTELRGSRDEVRAPQGWIGRVMVRRI